MDLPEHIGNGPAGDGSGHELEEWVNDSSRQVAPPSFLRRGFFSSTARHFPQPSARERPRGLAIGDRRPGIAIALFLEVTETRRCIW